MDKALLVGIDDYPDCPLSQCVRDIERTLEGIQSMFWFPPPGIRVLCDSRATTANIIARLHWLVEGAKPGGRLLFHYSGHGAQVATRNPRGEVDGLDEVICPVDFDWSDEHMIRDKQFAEIFASVPAGVEFIWLSDSCHSGDLQRDLGRRARLMRAPLDILHRNGVAKLLRGLRGRPRGLRGFAQQLNVALVSACADNETAAETDDGGAMTSALWQAIERRPRASLETLVRLAAKKVEGQTLQLAGPKAITRRPFLWQAP